VVLELASSVKSTRLSFTHVCYRGRMSAGLFPSDPVYRGISNRCRQCRRVVGCRNCRL
jgi:hypothetical protein